MGNCCKRRIPKIIKEEEPFIDKKNEEEIDIQIIEVPKKEEKEKKMKEILKRQEALRKENSEENKVQSQNQINIQNEQKVKETIEDMCVMGSIMKEEIIEEKKNNPEKFISIEEATQEQNKDSQIFCLGILAQNLEDMGIITAIEKNPSQNEEDQNKANTVLEFITNGMIEKPKYNLHFDLGEERNEELLNNKQEQEKFNNKLRKKLSIEYNIPEDKIIITNPQKGSYQVQVIFQTENFNKIDLNELKNKCKDDNTFKELSYLKEIHKTVIMDGIKLNPNMLDERGNRESGWGEGEQRGGFDYYPPIGWKGYGLNVMGKYDNGNDDWLDYDGNPNEWAVAYHGIGRWSNDVEGITKKILYGPEKDIEKKENFKPGGEQAYENYDDARHPGQKVGIGVYCSPKPDVMEEYAGTSSNQVNGKRFKMGFMMRVKPDKIRYSDDMPDYWVLNGTTDEMRPYRIMLKEDE